MLGHFCKIYAFQKSDTDRQKVFYLL